MGSSQIDSKQVRKHKDWLEIILTVLSIIIIRNLLEMYLKRPGGWTLTTLNDWMNWWFHFPLFFITLWLYGSLGFSKLLNLSFRRSARKISWFLLIIITGPIFDALTQGGSMPYLYIKDSNTLSVAFIHLLNPFKSLLYIGIPIGPRVEMLILMIVCLFTIWFNSKEKWVKKITIIISGMVMTYLGIYLLCCWPAVLSALLHLGNRPLFLTDPFYSEVYLLLCIICIAIAWFRSDKNNLKIILLFSRPFRLFHYLFLLISGSILSLNFEATFLMSNISEFPQLAIQIICGLLSFYCIFVSTTIVNDYTDQTEDKINRQSYSIEFRKSSFSFLEIATVLFVFAILLSFASGSGNLSIILLWAALSSIYSIPPLRLKRVIVISNMILSFSALLALAYGGLIVGALNPFGIINSNLFFLVFIVTFIGTFIKDLPDRNGDKLAKIATLPVILPPDKFKLFYVFLILICYGLCIYVTLPVSIAAFAILFPTAFSVYFIIKRPDSSTYQFIAYFIAIVIVVVIFKIQQ